MAGIRVLSLDLDDTLWPVGPTILAAEHTLLEWLRANCPKAVESHSLESMRGLRMQMAERFPERRHDLTFLRHRALCDQLIAAGYTAADADDAFEAFYAARNRVVLYEDVAPALDRLRGRYRLFALSNGNADLRRCGVAHWFEGHVNAQSAGAAKPDARIFDALARIAGVEARHILHVGDDPQADVAGARQAGLDTVWLRRNDQTWPLELGERPRTISALHELE